MRAAVPIVVVAAVLGVLAVGGFMLWRAETRTNKVALASAPKPVAVTRARASSFRAARTYVGTLAPWNEAKVGPQLVSAYVDSVVVRPGAVVRRSDILATLDCKSASLASQSLAMQARAIEARKQALASESARIQGLLDGGFVSKNDAEQKAAQVATEQAQLLATQAKLLGSNLEVSDCIMRAPFDGEIATRTIDPGAFVRPGTPIVSIVDRSTVRLSADAPEIDFGVVAPGTKVTIRIFATGRDMAATITRRAPSADQFTRTVHFEIDVPDPKREIPVNTTGEIRVDVGEPVAATELPLSAVSIRNGKVVLFVVDGDVARSKTFAMLGESGGSVFVETALASGTLVVSEGRALLGDGDRVDAKPAAPAGSGASKQDRP